MLNGATNMQWQGLKLAMLIATAVLIAVLATIKNTSLNAIYLAFGQLLHIDWAGLGLNLTSISNAGHGIGAFCISLLFLWNFRMAYWRCAFVVFAFFCVAELLQAYLPTRTASILDLIYSAIGITLALGLVMLIRKVTAR